MALVKCPECGEDISTEAFKCPKCGKTLRKRKRSFMGKLFKWLFILFNILMVVWLVTGMNAASNVVSSAASEAERAGAAIGTGIGVAMLLGVWGIGDVVLGIFVLLTRPRE